MGPTQRSPYGSCVPDSFGRTGSASLHLRSLRRSFTSSEDDADLEADSIESPSKPSHTYPNLKQNSNESMPVIMPGDQIPKFIALPCPCAPPRAENIITVDVQKPPQPPPPPPPPPRPPSIVYNHVARFGVYYDG
ncbi:hypothetical protein BVC80_1605g9 [Macleaya cordata]|uniref:Uncharacterized protein n=1 Tax=Macleaya cordata TaxID=56857 RepID=A0A200QA50_MACCD|nr:hypothetical protein BVC80_1605g9 [Macleaya cordata]